MDNQITTHLKRQKGLRWFYRQVKENLQKTENPKILPTENRKKTVLVTSSSNDYYNTDYEMWTMSINNTLWLSRVYPRNARKAQHQKI